MKKIFLTLIFGLIISLGLMAQNEMWIYNSDGTIKTCKISEIDSIDFSANMLNMLLHKNGGDNTLSVVAIDSIVFKQIINPGDDNQDGNGDEDADDNQGGNDDENQDDNGDGNDNTDDNQGGSEDDSQDGDGDENEDGDGNQDENEDDNQGDIPEDVDSTVVYIEFNGDRATVRYDVNLENFEVNIDGADVKIIAATGIKNIRYYLSGQTSDGSFALESDSEFDVVLNGVNITSSSKVPLDLAKKVERNIIVANGTTNVLTDNVGSSGKAALNTKGATNIKGAGSLTVNANKKHGISSDYDININGVTLVVNNTADASKGLKSDANIIINDADVTVVSSGSLVLEEMELGFDPTYCTAIGADVNFEMTGGRLSITLPASNVAGRGIKVDGDVSVLGGNINIVSHGGGNTYTNIEGAIDSYKSSCIKADGNIYFLAGNIVIEATGDAGKCVNADGKIFIGKENEGNEGLVMDLKTSGKKFYESGSGENADYANPKALSAEDDLYVYSGNINIYTSNDGGEGLESKNGVYIKGGKLVIDTYDDAINGKYHVQFDGGVCYLNSRGNDAIDSNGTMTVNGGFILAYGQTSPEGAFDCDQNTFTVTGGTLVGIGGHSSTPTSSVCTQRSVVYSGVTSGTALQIVDANGNDLLTLQVPTYSGGGSNPGGGGGWPGGGGGWPGGPGGSNGSLTLLYSSADLQQGTITVKQGGAISGGENFYGYYTDATYSGETSSKSITISGMVTTYGNSGGGPF